MVMLSLRLYRVYGGCVSGGALTMSDPTVSIRAETAQDYAAIADIHCRAFGEGYAEAQIVALHRQRPGYDPRLSLVAELDGVIIGHILYSSRTFRVMGEDAAGVNLSPLGVHPLYQGRGIGSALVEAGDSLARDLGYSFAIVLGHKEYYPRFGYLPNAYGGAKTVLPSAGLPRGDGTTLEMRKVLPTDAEALQGLWRAEEDEVDMSIVPDHCALAWYSPDPRISCTVYLSLGQVVGYTRIAVHEGNSARLFLAADGSAAERMVSLLARNGDVTLPLHPSSGSMSALARYGALEISANPYCMAKPLAPSPFDEYYDLVQRSERAPGRVIWPAEFDV